MTTVPGSVQMGDVLEWLGAPVLVLEDPNRVGDARAIYLRDSSYNPQLNPDGIGRTRKGTVTKCFRVSHKPLWTEPLTDAEQAWIMRLLLVGVNEDD